MKEKAITCNHLWKKWETMHPNGYQVVMAQEKIRSYSRDDWQEMYDDARQTVEQIARLIQEDTNILDPKSEEAFQKLLDHVRKYFFEPNEDYAKKVYFSILFDKEYRQFFNQFQDGMSNKILELIDTYPEKFK